MSESFNLNKIDTYKKECNVFISGYKKNTEATMAIFDKNYDLKISKSEYNKVSKEQYQKYIEQIKPEIEQDIEFHDYDKLKDFFDDGFVSFEELEGIVNDYGLKGKNLKEIKNLKDTTQMSDKEVLNELAQYGIKISSKNSYEIRETLNEVRNARSNNDKNSNVVDGHIGTFVQAENAMCTVLSVLETMSDDQIKQMYKTKKDKEGNVYYEITFPQDKKNGQKVIVTQKEIEDMAITIKNDNNSESEILNFSTGDADITMFEMAFVKRFGTEIFENGSELETARKIFSDDENQFFVRNTNLENIEKLENLPKNTTISLLHAEEFRNKGITVEPFKLQDGRTAKIRYGNLILSDGTEIHSNHAMSVKGYDKKTNELIISGNSLNSASELRIPAELLKCFAMALPDDFA